MAAKRVLEGLTVVTVGLILLANTTGVLPWTVWLSILMLWPLLLVAAGIDILGRALNSTALRVLASLVVIGGLVFAALATAGRLQAPLLAAGGQPQKTFSFSEPAGTAEAGRAEIAAGGGKLTLRAGDELATAEGETAFGEPSFSVDESGGAADVRVGLGNDRGGIRFPNRMRSDLDVTLDRQVEWSMLNVDAGLSEVDLDLSGLDVEFLDANFGMTSAVIEFGTLDVPGPQGMPGVKRRPEAKAEIDCGMSSVRIRVPKSVGVELQADNGLGSTNVQGGWTRTKDDGPFQGTWRSEGYESAPSLLRITVSAGLSSIDVVRY